MTIITSIKRLLVSLNQPYNYPGEKAEHPERSSALCGKEWGGVNSEVGGRTANYEELAFGLGIVRNYFNSFFNPEENPIVGFIIRALTGSSDFLEGKRDQEMYGEVYGHGINEYGGRDIDEIRHELVNDDLRKLSNRGDDLHQNKRQEALYGERIVSKFGEWATKFSIVKPIAHFISGALGNSWRMGIQTLLDFPAKTYWRIRFFTKALHSNFCTNIWDLTKFKFLSLFGSSDASGKYENKAKEIGEMSNEYFRNKYKNDYKSESNPGLGLYRRMLKDRMTEHWQNIRDPKAALERKCKDKFLTRTDENKRKMDPGQTFENGYVDPNAEYDQKEQRRLAIMDFTGPICAALGLVGTVVFDPLKVLWGAAGLETGKNLVNALSSSRKSFSLINYIFRFIIPEMHSGAAYKNLDEKYMNSEGIPKKAISELRYTRKSRYDNALIGMAMAVGNICEPLLHLKRGIISDSKVGNFLIDTVIRFNDTFFLRFFSKRREVQGREEYLKAALEEKRGMKFVKDEDFVKALSELENGEFDDLMKAGVQGLPEPGLGVIGSCITWCADKLKRVKAACSGEVYYSRAV